MTVDGIERVYDRYSGVYDFVFGKVLERGREMAPELLDLVPGARLLDVGFGTGLSLRYLPKDLSMVGIDISQTMLDVGRKRVRQLGFTDVQLIKMDATQLDFPDGSFDRVLAAYFISTVPDPVRVLGELKRVCRPGAKMVFLNHFLNGNPLVRIVEKAISPICCRLGFRTDLELRALMEAAGLRIERIEKIDQFGHWKAVRCVSV